MSSEITKAIQFICEDKGLTAEAVLDTIQIALGAAYRKDFGNKLQNVQVKFDPETGDMQVWDEKTVVPDVDVEAQEAFFQEYLTRKVDVEAKGETLAEEAPPRFNPKNEMMLKDAEAAQAGAAVGDVLKLPLEVPAAFGRMAAQTAKQVIIQKLREAERSTIFDDFKTKEGEIIAGTVQRREARGVLVDFGKISGIIPPQEQIQNEYYVPGHRIKVYVVSVAQGTRGPEIILSRSHTAFVARIFEAEIPEVASGVVKIQGIAREAGVRSKVAGATDDENIDPIGSCIGQRGSRIQVIIDELGGEKIDIIAYDADPKTYLAHALSPAKVHAVELNEEEKVAIVRVTADQFSLAIGRGGQNVRLAATLTGWRINVVQEGESGETFSSEDSETEGAVAPEDAPVEETKAADETPEKTE